MHYSDSSQTVSLDLFVGYAPEDRSEADSLIGRLIGRFDIGHICHAESRSAQAVDRRMLSGLERCSIAVLLASRACPVERLLPRALLDRAIAAGKTVVVLHLDGEDSSIDACPGAIHQPAETDGSIPTARPLHHSALLDTIVHKLVALSARLLPLELAETPASFSLPAPGGMATALPRRRRIHGRERELSLIVSFLDRDGPAMVLVDGGAGIGKTSVLEAVAHEPAIAARFGLRRCFLPLDGVSSACEAFTRLAEVLDLEPNLFCEADIRTELSRAPALILADDLGRGLDAVDARALAEAIVGLLRDTGASLIATTEPGMVVAECDMRPVPLDGLDEGSLRSMLFATARGIAAIDDGLSPLLAELRGNPLALRLLASACRNDASLSDVGDAWERAAQRLNGNDCPGMTALAAAIERAGGIERLGATLSLLASIPEGLPLEHLEERLPAGGFLAVISLLDADLADLNGPRIRLIPGIAAILPTVQAALAEHAATLGNRAELAGVAN